MPFKIATATASFRAPEPSEDRLAVHRVEGGAAVVVCICDGAGGIPGGGRAADVAIKAVENTLSQPGFNPFSASSWADRLVAIDHEIEADHRAGEATCVVVGITSTGRVVGVSVGDSGAIIIGTDGTIDDLTEKQKRKVRLGSGRASPVTFERADLEGTLVVASDGLLAYARQDVIARVTAAHDNLDEAARALVQAVRLPTDGYVDDIAIVLARRI